MAEEVVLMKGNEAIAHAAIRCGADGYFGYPITPQSEVLETLAELKPWETTGMVVLQAESEVAAINMVYGGAGSGKMVMTSFKSGVSLKTRRNLFLACRTSLSDCKCNAWRSGLGLSNLSRRLLQTVKGGWS
jgi:2-oxoglutarate ferredoxin oxidoreductase subunit alpha